MAQNEKIRIRLKSYDHKLLDFSAAKIVETAECGYTSPAENAEILAENIVKLTRLSKEERLKMGENAMNYFNNNFEREMLLDKLISILVN